MLLRLTLNGYLKAGSEKPIEPSIDVIVDEDGIWIGKQVLLARTALKLSPFHGRMFYMLGHNDEEEIVEREYKLVMAGSNFGYYENGGGRDGEFRVFHLKEVEIRANFSDHGLKIDIDAKTLPGDDVCYSADDRLKNAFQEITVVVSFVVPPESLPAFLGLPNFLSRRALSKFKWHQAESTT